jgi:3-deoxy-D-manno-octulosonate 8-phosphate phosphatase (KDO 8-P phosphatase)
VSSIGPEAKRRASRVKLLLLDVDGVLTDGLLIYDGNGGELRGFAVQDGTGILILGAMGIRTGFVTTRAAPAVRRRAHDLDAFVYGGVAPKVKVLEEITEKYSVAPEDICFVGDDVNDLSIMQAVGFPVAVANATAETKEIACYVTVRSGGHGAVREVIDLILEAQGKREDARQVALTFGGRPARS